MEHTGQEHTARWGRWRPGRTSSWLLLSTAPAWLCKGERQSHSEQGRESPRRGAAARWGYRAGRKAQGARGAGTPGMEEAELPRAPRAPTLQAPGLGATAARPSSSLSVHCPFPVRLRSSAWSQTLCLWFPLARSSRSQASVPFPAPCPPPLPLPLGLARWLPGFSPPESLRQHLALRCTRGHTPGRFCQIKPASFVEKATPLAPLPCGHAWGGIRPSRNPAFRALEGGCGVVANNRKEPQATHR